MARLNHGSATSTKSRAQGTDAPTHTDPGEAALAAVGAAFPKLLLHATRLVDRFSASAAYTPHELVQEVTIEVLDAAHGEVDPIAYCIVRMRQLVSNAVRNRARRDELADRARDVVHPMRDPPPSAREREDIAAAARRVMEHLTSAACEDDVVFTLLDGFSKVAQRDDVINVRKKRVLVLEATGLDAATYSLALKRLATLVRGLPPDLQRDALVAIGGNP